MRYNPSLIALIAWGFSLQTVLAACRPTQSQLNSNALCSKTGRRRGVTYASLLPIRGGGKNDASSVSVSPDQTLPAGIAGASLTAFRAPSVPINTRDTNETHDNEIEETPDTEASHTDESASVDLSIPSPSPSMLAKRLANIGERTVPALLMLAGVGSIAKYLKEDGLIGLTLLLQVGMYQETTRMVGGDFPHVFYKWWWFITASIALNAPRILSWATKEIAASVLGMTLFGIVSVIVRFNWKGAEVDEFRDFIRQGAVSFLASLLVMLPSSYWIATLEEFGMKMVALPVALVIINDTMAYFFGIAFGRHKLLPVISPSKTWEGFLGAAASTAVAAHYLLESRQDALVLSVAVSIIGPFGGFLASMIKRAYVQKDFGTLFPGHGGLVDRLDCHLILAPIVFMYLSMTSK